MIYTLADEPYRGRTGRGVTVAVLDSGIHAGHPHVGAVRGGISFVVGGDSTDITDRIGHGTAVAAAIREKSPGVELVSVRIFDRTLATSADVLARAIAWSAAHGAQLINLSLGTANPAHAALLQDALDEAASLGSVVVSAREANGVRWMPGSLRGCAAVDADASLERDEIEIIELGQTSRYTASPYPRPIPDVPREQNLSGVSFAVANVTGFLARTLESRQDQ